eukprot:TRINITY_DN2435_c0_g1_i13.p2 TRINITY_DN2435_c0_g1~~TRINITY_DN2435_c0_g1_i13.p2  ORF type:complete len:191 (-),score=24.43 TRINITY_DN2435_c0_g1_i13:162-734(-)
MQCKQGCHRAWTISQHESGRQPSEDPGESPKRQEAEAPGDPQPFAHREARGHHRGNSSITKKEPKMASSMEKDELQTAKAPAGKVSAEQRQSSKEEVKSENSPLESRGKGENLFVRNDLLSSSRVSRSEEFSKKPRVYPQGNSSIQEDVKGEENEELHESNYSNKSHLDASEKSKIVGSRIAFINHDSYI